MKKLLCLFLLACSLSHGAVRSPPQQGASGAASITSGTITGVTIDNSVIGGTTPAAGTFTNIQTTGTITSGGTIFGNASASIVTTGTVSAGGIVTAPSFVANNASATGYTALSGTLTNPGFKAGTAVFYSGGSGVTLGLNGSNVIAFGSSAINFLSNGAVSLGTANVGASKIYIDYTNTGTVGNVTINKAAGRVNLGAGGTTLTLTNSVITAASKCFLNPDGAPGNVVAVLFYCVVSAGSATINAVPAITSQTAIDFFIVNAD